MNRVRGRLHDTFQPAPWAEILLRLTRPISARGEIARQSERPPSCFVENTIAKHAQAHFSARAEILIIYLFILFFIYLFHHTLLLIYLLLLCYVSHHKFVGWCCFPRAFFLEVWQKCTSFVLVQVQPGPKFAHYVMGTGLGLSSFGTFPTL